MDVFSSSVYFGYLPSHILPEYPFEQLQVKLFPDKEQIPSCKQGWTLQGVTTSKIKTKLQAHILFIYLEKCRSGECLVASYFAFYP